MSSIPPFEITFDTFKYFQHGKKSTTLWLYPSEQSDSLQKIESELVKAFPTCTDLVNRSDAGFVPHLSVGQFKGEGETLKFKEKFEQNWNPITFTVNCIYFISRNDTDPFEVRKAIPLSGKTQSDSDFEEKKQVEPQRQPGQISLFVGGLSPTTTSASLKKHFESNCKVLKVNLPVDARTKKQRGFGFVDCVPADGFDVINNFNRTTLDGKSISVKFAK